MLLYHILGIHPFAFILARRLNILLYEIFSNCIDPTRNIPSSHLRCRLVEPFLIFTECYLRKHQILTIQHKGFSDRPKLPISKHQAGQLDGWEAALVMSSILWEFYVDYSSVTSSRTVEPHLGKGHQVSVQFVVLVLHVVSRYGWMVRNLLIAHWSRPYIALECFTQDWVERLFRPKLEGIDGQ